MTLSLKSLLLFLKQNSTSWNSWNSIMNNWQIAVPKWYKISWYIVFNSFKFRLIRKIASNSHFILNCVALLALWSSCCWKRQDCEKMYSGFLKYLLEVWCFWLFSTWNEFYDIIFWQSTDKQGIIKHYQGFVWLKDKI